MADVTLSLEEVKSLSNNVKEKLKRDHPRVYFSTKFNSSPNNYKGLSASIENVLSNKIHSEINIGVKFLRKFFYSAIQSNDERTFRDANIDALYLFAEGVKRIDFINNSDDNFTKYKNVVITSSFDPDIFGSERPKLPEKFSDLVIDELLVFDEIENDNIRSKIFEKNERIYILIDSKFISEVAAASWLVELFQHRLLSLILDKDLRFIFSDEVMLELIDVSFVPQVLQSWKVAHDMNTEEFSEDVLNRSSGEINQVDLESIFKNILHAIKVLAIQRRKDDFGEFDSSSLTIKRLKFDKILGKEPIDLVTCLSCDTNSARYGYTFLNVFSSKSLRYDSDKIFNLFQRSAIVMKSPDNISIKLISVPCAKVDGKFFSLEKIKENEELYSCLIMSQLTGIDTSVVFYNNEGEALIEPAMRRVLWNHDFTLKFHNIWQSQESIELLQNIEDGVISTSDLVDDESMELYLSYSKDSKGLLSMLKLSDEKFLPYKLNFFEDFKKRIILAKDGKHCELLSMDKSEIEIRRRLYISDYKAEEIKKKIHDKHQRIQSAIVSVKERKSIIMGEK